MSRQKTVKEVKHENSTGYDYRDQRSCPAGNRSSDRFPATRWSVILSCADAGTADPAVRDALSQFCQNYWRPIFAFICHRGYSVSDAQASSTAECRSAGFALNDPIDLRHSAKLLRAIPAVTG
jgi:hypothetical protein